ncbi:MAG: hypothetical protein CM1200mP30_13880 [Pseudomonadota bacterium]|nr:MAG: hypothetical protein CM1200mP30_13880 [Pseudomonadota bacterium]
MVVPSLLRHSAFSEGRCDVIVIDGMQGVLQQLKKSFLSMWGSPPA